MNSAPLTALFGWLLLATTLHAALGPAPSSLPRDYAHQAVAMLGPGIWSRVVRIDNANRSSRYPATTFATVFEFGGILWFYCALDGTQSLSLEYGQLAADKADLNRLLVAIEPGFRRYVEDPTAALAGPFRPLPNGCVVESIAFGCRRLDEGLTPADVRLLQVVTRLKGRLVSHMLLLFRERGVWRVFDPSVPHERATLTALDPAAPLACARQVGKRKRYREPIQRAQLFPFDASLADALRAPRR